MSEKGRRLGGLGGGLCCWGAGGVELGALAMVSGAREHRLLASSPAPELWATVGSLRAMSTP
eukprot:COSAG04_NODE_323_length_16882_cov_5.975627_23_plen_62_part_00